MVWDPPAVALCGNLSHKVGTVGTGGNTGGDKEFTCAEKTPRMKGCAGDLFKKLIFTTCFDKQSSL